MARIERELGRRRSVPKGPRSIDIDILLFGWAVVDTPELRSRHEITMPAGPDRSLTVAAQYSVPG